MKLKKGDTVKVITGKDAGTESKIAKVFPTRNMPIDASNVMIVCSDCGPTRIGAKFDDEGRKYRVCRKCGGEL